MSERIALPANDEIHVWQAQLDDSRSDIGLLHSTLTPDERDRASRFYFEKHRRRFIAGRGILRILLGRYLGVEAGEIRFDYSEKGKPSVANPKVENFGWNVSHSGDLALYAFALDVPIGVDVEILRPIDEMDGIAKRFFSPLEYEMLQRVPPADRIEAFFCCWTRKEAYVKAEGLGLSIPLDSFAVSVVPLEPARFIHLGPDALEAGAWALHHLRLGSGAVGAVAIPALNRKVLVRRFC